MAKVYRCYGENGSMKWTVDIYIKPDSVYPDVKFYLNKKRPDFDTLFDTLHSIYGIDHMLMQP